MKKQLPLSILIGLAIVVCAVFTAKSQCSDTLPASTIILTSDTTIGSGSVNSHYLICPGVEVIYSGTQSIMNHYYLESGARLTLNSYHYPYLYLKTTAEINAQHSINPASIIMAVYAETGAIFIDTLDPYTPVINWCNPLVFNYINLPNGEGCPSGAVITRYQQSEINIYPNPFNIKTTIESRGRSLSSIEITDLTGQMVYSSQVNSKTVTVERNGLKEGIYFLKITDEFNNIANEKIIIQ